MHVCKSIYIYVSLSLFNEMIDSLNENHWDPNRLTNPPSRNGQMRSSDATRCQTSTNSPSLASALVRWRYLALVGHCGCLAQWVTKNNWVLLYVTMCCYILLCIYNIYIYIYVLYIYIYICVCYSMLLIVTVYVTRYLLQSGVCGILHVDVFFGGQNNNPEIGFRTLAVGIMNY